MGNKLEKRRPEHLFIQILFIFSSAKSIILSFLNTYFSWFIAQSLTANHRAPMKMTPLEHGGVISIRIEETRVITGAFCSAKTSQHQPGCVLVYQYTKERALANCVTTPCMDMKTIGIPPCTSTPGQPHQSPKQSYLLNRSASKERFNCAVST